MTKKQSQCAVFFFLAYQSHVPASSSAKLQKYPPPYVFLLITTKHHTYHNPCILTQNWRGESIAGISTTAAVSPTTTILLPPLSTCPNKQITSNTQNALLQPLNQAEHTHKIASKEKKKKENILPNPPALITNAIAVHPYFSSVRYSSTSFYTL